MELGVKVVEARNLPAVDPSGLSNPYVRLELGRNRFRTSVVIKNLNPSWGEEFYFLADDLIGELEVSVLSDNKDFSDDLSDEFLGQVKVPITRVLNAEDKSLGTAWYSLQPEGDEIMKEDCGVICLQIFLPERSAFPDFPGAGKSMLVTSSPPPEAGKNTSGDTSRETRRKAFMGRLKAIALRRKFQALNQSRKQATLRDLSVYMWGCFHLSTYFILTYSLMSVVQVISGLYHISPHWSFTLLLSVLPPCIRLTIDPLMELYAIQKLHWQIFAKLIMVALCLSCWYQGTWHWFGALGFSLLSPFIILLFYLRIQEGDSTGSLRVAKQERKEIESYTKGILLLLGDGYQFEKEMLIQLWMAMGFIKNEPMEIDGAIYFEELVSRRYILPSDSNFLYEVNRDKMSAFRDNSHYVKLGSTSQIDATPAETVHASVVGDQINESIFKTLCKFSRLRTLFFRCTRSSRLEQLPVDIFLSFESLVVLDLSRTDIKELPSSALKMLHLRYLDLSWTPIELVPETIYRFQRLQTLKLRGCYCLWKLPSEMKRLVELRHLDFDVLGQLVDMPERMGVLVNLRTLSSFIVGTQEGCSITELRNLNNLTGEFCIARLEHVQSARDAKMASLRAKKHLNKFELRWSDFPLQKRESQDVKVILRNLRPHPDLEELLIRCYSGVQFPRWIGLEPFHKLARITLFKCEHVSMLPSMGKLPSLEYLGLYSLNSVMEVRFEVDHAAYPKLRELVIDEMRHLNAWTEGKEGDFPCLVELTIKDCPELPELPLLAYLSSLKRLVISSCPKVQFVDGQQLSPSLEFLVVEECPLIEETCLEEDGKRRDKIKHVQNVWIDQEATFDLRDDDDDDKDDSEQSDENYSETEDDGTEGDVSM